MSGHAYHVYKKKKRVNKKKKSKHDPLIWFAVGFGPIMTLPQIYEIWIKGNTGVSILSWAAYTLVAGVWLWHALKVKDKALIVVQSLWLVLDATIVIGLLLN